MADLTLLTGDCLDLLPQLDAGGVQTCITSPPYYGLRDYGAAGQLGLEATPAAYVARLVDVFRQVRRVLRDDGTLWLNLGDSYGGPAGNTRGPGAGGGAARGRRIFGSAIGRDKGGKAKDLLGIPWRVAFALQADGWVLRSDVIWHKPNPMPESVRDRPTKSHEYLFLLSKRLTYYYDADAIREPASCYGRKHASTIKPPKVQAAMSLRYGTGPTGQLSTNYERQHRNRRTVWTCATAPLKEAHFAAFPPKLIEPCVLACSHPGDLVLDPFSGAGTTGLVALRHGRRYLGIELNRAYNGIAKRRLAAAGGADVAAA